MIKEILCLSMFPLSLCGSTHGANYTIGDVISRYKLKDLMFYNRLGCCYQQKNTIQNKGDPQKTWTEKNIANV